MRFCINGCNFLATFLFCSAVIVNETSVFHCACFKKTHSTNKRAQKNYTFRTIFTHVNLAAKQRLMPCVFAVWPTYQEGFVTPGSPPIGVLLIRRTQRPYHRGLCPDLFSK